MTITKKNNAAKGKAKTRSINEVMVLCNFTQQLALPTAL